MELISLLPDIKQAQDLSENVWTCSCTSSISKTSLPAFSQTQQLQVNSSICVMHHIHNVRQWRTACIKSPCM